MAETVKVPFDKPSDQAVLLLAAAEELGLDSSVVQTRQGAFVVPEEVNEKAFGEKKKTSTKKTQKKKEE